MEESLSPLRAAMARRQHSASGAQAAERQQQFLHMMQLQLAAAGQQPSQQQSAPPASPSPGSLHGPSRFAPLLNAGVGGVPVPGGGSGWRGGGGGAAVAAPAGMAGSRLGGPSAKALANYEDEFSEGGGGEGGGGAGRPVATVGF
jgi:hypothetical protein